MCLGHCKSQHEIPICYNLKALGCLDFNKYLLEWNHRDSSETMKMPLFVNTFLWEPTVLIECCSLDGFYKQKPIQTGSSRPLLKAMSSLPCIVFKTNKQTTVLKPFIYFLIYCVGMHVWTCMCTQDAGVCEGRCCSLVTIHFVFGNKVFHWLGTSWLV